LQTQLNMLKVVKKHKQLLQTMPKVICRVFAS